MLETGKVGEASVKQSGADDAARLSTQVMDVWRDTSVPNDGPVRTASASAERTAQPDVIDFPNPYEHPAVQPLSKEENNIVDGILNQLGQDRPDQNAINQLIHKGIDNEAMTRIFGELNDRLRTDPRYVNYWAYHNIPRIDSRGMAVNNFVVMDNIGNQVFNIPRSWPADLGGGN